jgi:hypothetical protein
MIKTENKDNKYNTIWLSRVYALLRFSSPDTASRFTNLFTNEAQVAASLLTSANLFEKYSITITDNSDDKHSFIIDTDSKKYQSKGNWLWVTRIDFYYAEEIIFSISMNKNIIDIPYSGKYINAYWLLKDLDEAVVAELTKIKDLYF